jgi:hypothetical protein
MPTNFIAVPGTNTIYAMFQATLPAAYADNSTLWDRRFAYAMRAPKTMCLCRWTYEQPAGWWPAPRGMGFYSDPAAPVSPWGLIDAGCTLGGWEPITNNGAGNAHTKFIRGRCVDGSSVGVSGAVVQGFLTATDAYVGETTADSDGNYELGTPNPGAQHYLVAYRAGSPDIAGTTVNTLTPTNRDGT